MDSNHATMDVYINNEFAGKHPIRKSNKYKLEADQNQVLSSDINIEFGNTYLAIFPIEIMHGKIVIKSLQE